MAKTSSRTALRLIKNPLVQRFLIWLAPIVLRYVAAKLRNRRASGSGRKHVRSKTK
jgi:hypothetical protein